MKRSTASASNNILLLKDDVGKPKPDTRRLPSKSFVFGKAEYRDNEGAQQGK